MDDKDLILQGHLCVSNEGDFQPTLTLSSDGVNEFEWPEAQNSREQTIAQEAAVWAVSELCASVEPDKVEIWLQSCFGRIELPISEILFGLISKVRFYCEEANNIDKLDPDLMADIKRAIVNLRSTATTLEQILNA